MILREDTHLDPRVEKVTTSIRRRLNRRKIAFVLVGGVLLNQFQVGRPTYDVDIVVAAADWQKTVDALKSLAVDSERMGEPEPGALLRTKLGPMIEIFPEGLTASQIARIRGSHRRHRAGAVSFRLKGDPLANLITYKLASHLSAKDRLQDLSDVQRLIKKQDLDPDFAIRLDRRVRTEFRKLAKGLKRP
jgi:hypothetical protein